MKKYYIIAFCIALPAHPTKEPANLGLTKLAVRDYYQSGTYLKEVTCVAQQIKKCIDQYSPYNGKQVIVFDIDDTLISSWCSHNKNDFGYNHKIASLWAQESDCPAIEPMRDAYYYAMKAGLKIVIITGRNCSYQDVVVKNLHKAGYYGWDNLYLRSKELSPEERAHFKASMRSCMERNGFTIIINVGDQESDLSGGFARHSFKLPNPLYFTD